MSRWGIQFFWFTDKNKSPKWLANIIVCVRTWNIRVAKFFNDKPDSTCLLYSFDSFKTLAKNQNQMFWIPDPSLNLEALLFPKIDVHVPHLHSVRYPIDNYCILLLWILSLYQTRMLAGVGIDVQRSCGAENRAVIFVGNT